MLLKKLSETLSKLNTEDRIVLLRGLAGLVYGTAIFIASMFVDHATLSIYAWSTSILAYYITIGLVAVKYKPTSRFQLYIRGLGTFYATWLLTSIILHEATKYIGLMLSP